VRPRYPMPITVILREGSFMAMMSMPILRRKGNWWRPAGQDEQAMVEKP
jgi:hypothetical protein